MSALPPKVDILRHVICDAPANDMPAIIAGVPGHPIENVSVSDVFMVQKGGALAALANVDPPEQERGVSRAEFVWAPTGAGTAGTSC
jgi:hypothetical protein